MNKNFLPPPLKIGNLTVPIPIIQGGMGIAVSMSGLASAVAKEGGVGVISSAMIGMTEPDFYKTPQESTFRALEKHIKIAKNNVPNGIIGVNIMVALENYDKQVEVTVKAGADLIISGAGLPLKLPAYIAEDSDIKLLPIISSPRAAKIICKRWHELYKRYPDAIVVEGPEAGGHLGFKAEELETTENKLENLIPEVIKAVAEFKPDNQEKIPVIAAGGIYSGLDMYNIMKLGADGVQMATRFVATHECDASDKFKQAYINAQKEDVEIVISPVGMPGRALRNVFIENVKKGDKRPRFCTNKCLKTCDYKTTKYCISNALINAQRGNLDAGLIFCGSNVWKVDKIISVHDLIQTILEEYNEAAEKDSNM